MLFLNFLGKILVPILGKKVQFFFKLGKNSVVFSQIGKVYHLNWDFSANWERCRSNGKFLSQLGKNLVMETGPSFV